MRKDLQDEGEWSVMHLTMHNHLAVAGGEIEKLYRREDRMLPRERRALIKRCQRFRVDMVALRKKLDERGGSQS